MQAYKDSLLGEDIEQIMIRTARDVFLPPATPGFDVYTGYGIVQASAALDYIAPPRYLRHKSVGFQGTSGTLAFADSTPILIRLFNEPNGLSNNFRNATRVHLCGNGSFGPGFQGPPTVWVRSSGTFGWDSLNTFDFGEDVMWGRVVAGTVMDTAATFDTFVYRIGATAQLWFPCRPESARVAYTTVGAVDSQVVGVETHETSPRALRVGPNPTRGRLTIEFTLQQKGMVKLHVIDVAGRVVATIVEGELEEGAHQLSWDGKSDSGVRSRAGIYLCRLEASGRQEVKKFAYVAWPKR